MAKFDTTTIDKWKTLAANWLATHGERTRESVTRGVDAWTIAHRAGITERAYRDRTVTDGHIQTALEQIFPNVVFKDPKVY